jgi:hypothetical protein
MSWRTRIGIASAVGEDERHRDTAGDGATPRFL